MTETAKIFYHKPKVRRTSAALRKEILLNAEFTLERMAQESKLPDIRERIPDPVRSIPQKKNMTECFVPRDSVFNCVSNTLRSLGLTGKYDGFLYICRAVEEILKYEDSPHFQSIYYDIGKEYDVNRCSVERSIRYSISYIRRTGNYSKLATIFGDAVADEKNFSNSKFLTILAADVFEKLTSIELDA